MPHMAAHLAGELNKIGYEPIIFDCFGLNPHNRRIINDLMLLGVDEDFVVENLSLSVEVVFLYCRTIEDIISTERIAIKIKEKKPEIKIFYFENNQTVNSFSLKELAEELLNKAGDVAIFGEPEDRIPDLIYYLFKKNVPIDSIKGIAFKDNNNIIKFTEKAPFNKNLDNLALPYWEKFPLDGYWITNYAHAPCKKNNKFLPIITSRGCPYRCNFCIAPITNPTWRARSPKNVVDEMEFFYKKMNIKDFHVSDLDPTVYEKRTIELCNEIIKRKLKISWKLAQGTKIETIKSEKTLELMKEAGCNFISFSPESGSKEMLVIMNKRVNFEYMLRLTKKMNKLRIRTQACFIIGVPGETEKHRKENLVLVKKLVKAGVDEIAASIFTPLPGTKLSSSLTGYSHYSQLTHSPNWRKDYKEIKNCRNKMYMTFFIYKFFLWPKKFLRESSSLFTKSFETKMEMSIYKLIKTYLIYYFPVLFLKLDSIKKIQKLKFVKR